MTTFQIISSFPQLPEIDQNLILSIDDIDSLYNLYSVNKMKFHVILNDKMILNNLKIKCNLEQFEFNDFLSLYKIAKGYVNPPYKFGPIICPRIKDGILPDHLQWNSSDRDFWIHKIKSIMQFDLVTKIRDNSNTWYYTISGTEIYWTFVILKNIAENKDIPSLELFNLINKTYYLLGYDRINPCNNEYIPTSLEQCTIS
jgi:hypothetical protein